MTGLVRRWYGVATGGLHWSPRQFWESTIDEFVMAVAGHNEAQGVGRGSRGGDVTPLTRAEMEALERKHLRPK